MGILDWLLGRRPSANTPAVQPSAAESGDDESVVIEHAGQPQARARLDRAPRVQLGPLHNIQFRHTEPRPSSPIQLANISATGIGFIRGAGDDWPTIGSIVIGELSSGASRQPVSARVVHLSQKVVGCAFVGETADVRDFVNQYFKVEIAALRMNPVAANMLKPVPDGTPSWVCGTNNCEVYLVSQGSKLVRFNFSFFANYVEGGADKPTRFGTVVADEADKVSYSSASGIHWEEPATEQSRLSALRFIQSVPGLSDSQRGALVSAISLK